MDNKFYKIGTGIGIAAIIIIISCIVMARNRDKKIAKDNQSMIMSSANISGEDTSNLQESKKEEFNQIENQTNMQTEKKSETKATEVKTNTKAAVQEQKQQNAKKTTTNTTTKNQEQEKKEEVTKDPTFKYPVKGEVTQNFAKDQLVYSQTLGEWVTHNGIDIKANKTTVVTASADGQVKSIKNDPRYGLTVVIEHSNGFSTVYSNLLTAEFVSVGEKVKSGQTIGTVGNTASFEILDEPHLHFEIMKNGEVVDPNMYLKN